MKSQYGNTLWLIKGKPSFKNHFRLFCFPYAGGGASIFRQWQEKLSKDVEVCPVQLPGRENRFAELPYTILSSLVKDMFEALVPYFDMPFAFFGHSLGAKIAFELARELRRKQDVQPLHLFVSGNRAPHIPEPRPLHMLPEEEIIMELRRYSGTPETVLQSKELMEMYLPILRADFSVDETYTYYEDAPLGCPITAFGGSEDKEASREEIGAWRQHTLSSFSFQMFQGDHFFIKSSQSLVLDSIAKDLLRYHDNTKTSFPKKLL